MNPQKFSSSMIRRTILSSVTFYSTSLDTGLGLKKFIKILGSISILFLSVYWLFIAQHFYNHLNPFHLYMIWSAWSGYLIITMGMFRLIVIFANKKTFIQLIDFINLKTLMHKSLRALDIRKKAYDFNIKISLLMNILGFLASLSYVTFSPLPITAIKSQDLEETFSVLDFLLNAHIYLSLILWQVRSY